MPNNIMTAVIPSPIAITKLVSLMALGVMENGLHKF